MSSNQQRPQTTISKIKSIYTPKTRLTLTFHQNSPYTKQSFKEECDINTIMSRYQSTGVLPELNTTAPQYLDVSAGIEFQQAMEYVAGAQTLFQELPSSIRNQFDNDPAAFLDFCGQEKNRPELAAMGLLKLEIAEAILNPQPPQTNVPTAPEIVPEKPA